MIHFRYDPESLADVPASEYEARVYDAFRARWPGYLIDLQGCHGRTWGCIDDETEIPAADIREVANDVFNQICNEG